MLEGEKMKTISAVHAMWFKLAMYRVEAEEAWKEYINANSD